MRVVAIAPDCLRAAAMLSDPRADVDLVNTSCEPPPTKALLGNPPTVRLSAAFTADTRALCAPSRAGSPARGTAAANRVSYNFRWTKGNGGRAAPA